MIESSLSPFFPFCKAETPTIPNLRQQLHCTWPVGKGGTNQLLQQMLHNAHSTSSDHGVGATKKKRRPAGTPDPDAEVVSLSPTTLLESDRYVCEICNQGFQRDQNLQMHRRRHKVPWQLLKRSETEEGGKAKKVYVCPETTCLHHDPRHALGDLVGIKKHFRRKHSTNKQWVCGKCAKAYAVQSDYKAHLKTCGTRGHNCDCGRVFSRVESFIEHQDVCTLRQFSDHLAGGASLKPSANNSSRTESSSSASTEPNHVILSTNSHHNLDLSIGLGRQGGDTTPSSSSSAAAAAALREYANEQLRLASAEKAFAEEARQQARRQVEIAEMEFANAQRIRLQAQSEMERAHLLKEQACRKISSTLTHLTCPTCKLQFRYPTSASLSRQPCEESSSLAMSYMSSATTDGD